MTYEILFSDFALKQWLKLPKDIQRRMVATLKRCRIRPYPHVIRLVGSPLYRLRVGDYRIILDIVENKLVILVVDISHRKNVYKRSRKSS